MHTCRIFNVSGLQEIVVAVMDIRGRIASSLLAE